MQSVPEMILDNIPSLPEEANAIEHIGLEYATPILQKYLLGAKLKDIAEYNGESVGNVQRKIRFGIRLIRKIKS